MCQIWKNGFMKKRLVYMFVALVAAVLLNYLPSVSFLSDKGILYNRSYTIDQHLFQVLQTNLQNGLTEVSSVQSIEGLWYCYTALWVSCLLVLLCFFSAPWRLRLATLSIVLAGGYYALFLYYIVGIVGEYFPTPYPHIGIILPAIIIQMMILVRRTILSDLAEQDEQNEEIN